MSKSPFFTPALKRVLAQLDLICQEYVDSYCEPGKAIDVPWFYNERASLSQFAGAVWRANPTNHVLEEYACEKQDEGSDYKGRRDIWFRIEGQQYWAEAKQHWGTLSNFTNHLTKACKIALVERNDLSDLQGRIGVGMCFVSWKELYSKDRLLPVGSGTEIHEGMLIHHFFPSRLQDPAMQYPWVGMSLVLVFDPMLVLPD